MDPRYPREGNPRKRAGLRQMCSLCNEPSLPAKEQLTHFTSAVHRHMKQIKQKQFSYTKNLRTLEEKINASEEQNEPVIGLEYIYQYAADKRGVAPYVCTLCECVCKVDTIFFHVVGVRHRSVYLSKNFPAMGIERNFRVKSSSEYRKLLSAAEIVEKSHGRKKMNVFNTLFNPKKNGGMKYDAESAGEGLSSSEDERDNPDSAAAASVTKPFHTDDRKPSRSGDDRSANRRGKPQFQGDRRGGPPDVGPPFQYDGRRGPEAQDGHVGMNRDHRDSGFQHDGHRGHYHRQEPELSYPPRGPGGREAPGRRDLPEDRNADSPMHRGGEGFQYGDPNDGAFARSRGHPHGDFDLPPMGLLPQPVNCDDMKGLPPGFPGDRDLQSQMQRGGSAFQYGRPEPTLQGGPGHPDNGFDFRHNDPRDGYHRLPLSPSRKQVNRTDESYAPAFPGDRNPCSRDATAFQYDRPGPQLPGGPRLADNQARTSEREFAFQHDESIQSPGNPRGDLGVPSMGQLRQPVHQGGIQGQSATPSFAPGGDPDLFQYNDRRGPALPGGPRDIGNQLRSDDRDFAYQRLPGSAHGDPDMPSMAPLHQRADHDAMTPHNRAQNRPPFGDRDLQSQMHDGRGFPSDDRQRPRDGARHTGNQVRESNKDRRTRWDDPRGDPDMPAGGPLRQQAESHDFRSLGRTQNHPPDFPGDGTPMHRDESQYGDRQGPMSRGDPRHADSQSQDRAFVFRHGAGLLDDDPTMPSMGHQPEDGGDLVARHRTQSHPADFSGVRRTRVHRNGAEFQRDDRHLQPHADRGGAAFPYDNAQRELPPGDNLLDQASRGSAFQPDQQRPHVSYQQGDRRQGFPEDRALPRGGTRHDERSMRGDPATYPELKTAYQSGAGRGHGGMDEQDVTYDSDMEVCSMELSDCDSDAFLCNAELFEFLKTFHILSYEDEQFALKVRDMFTSSTIRYRNLKEELLRRRIAEEKERLEEEKKAFLEVRRAKERPKKDRPKPSAPGKNYAPAPSSKPLLPTPTSGAAGGAGKPTPLMSILVDPVHPPPGAANPLQPEQRPPTMPPINIHSERRSRWDQESLQTSSEIHLEERFSVPPPRHGDPARNFPPRFPPHTGSAKY